MKYIYYMAFISAVIILGWIMRPLEEHMTTGTCKRPVYGPKGVDPERAGGIYPEIYGPNGNGSVNRRKQSGDTQIGNTILQVQGVASKEDGNGVTIPTSTTGMYEDNGEFRSDTATKNAAYMNVFTYKPYAKMDFPVTGPPAPYLSDFAGFHR